jgi:formylmethanofuran--tetrahydromethanopterin N-formyltransferase
MAAIIEDTYAEAFKSFYVEFLITARDRTWLDHAVAAATGNASSTIMCDCEAGLDRYVGPGTAEPDFTPDGRPGAVVQLHVPKFRKDWKQALERTALVRISQNVLTCPTAACFNLLDTEDYFRMGRKVAYFGNGYQKRIERFGRKMWWVPILGGEFVLDRRLGFASGLMGGNLWLFGKDVDPALEAAARGAVGVAKTPGVILPFPGGVAASGSKAGSKYRFAIASTYEKYCPELREIAAVESQVPAGVRSIMEIIINGRDLEAINVATQAAIAAAKDTPGLIRISAGNYGGRLGKSFIYLLGKESALLQK